MPEPIFRLTPPRTLATGLRKPAAPAPSLERSTLQAKPASHDLGDCKTARTGFAPGPQHPDGLVSAHRIEERHYRPPQSTAPDWLDCHRNTNHFAIPSIAVKGGNILDLPAFNLRHISECARHERDLSFAERMIAAGSRIAGPLKLVKCRYFRYWIVFRKPKRARPRQRDATLGGGRRNSLQQWFTTGRWNIPRPAIPGFPRRCS